MAANNSQSPFLEHVRNTIRTRRYGVRTEQAYVHWIKGFILYHGKRHPQELGEDEVGRFLSHLAVERQVSANTRNQALNALLFLYRHVLRKPLAGTLDTVHARR
jgi:site-specific recombinase XerD